MPRALIIDDEALARADLRTQLAAHREIEVVGEAALIDDARELLSQPDYDLVFLDIQLLGGTGFDLVPFVRPEARIIFVTAFDQYAFRAFEVNALDYVRKPVNPARLAESVRRIGQVVPPPPPAPALSINDLVSVKTGPGARRFIRVADIVAISSEDNYSSVWLSNGEHHLVRQTLTAWQERLPSSHFLRVHRRNIVNVACIEGFEHQDEKITTLRLASLRTTFRARRTSWAQLSTRLAALGVHL